MTYAVQFAQGIGMSDKKRLHTDEFLIQLLPFD